MNTKQIDLIEKRKDSKMSSGERTVFDFLIDKKIRFEREFFFKEFINTSTGYHLFFDFYLYQLNIVIEVDGEHHYKPVNGVSGLLYQQQKDNLKNKFCKQKGIKIIRLRYEKGIIRIGKLEHLLIKTINKKVKPQKKRRVITANMILEKKKAETMKNLKSKIKQQAELVDKKRQEARKYYPSDILEKLNNRLCE